MRGAKAEEQGSDNGEDLHREDHVSDGGRAYWAAGLRRIGKNVDKTSLARKWRRVSTTAISEQEGTTQKSESLQAATPCRCVA